MAWLSPIFSELGDRVEQRVHYLETFAKRAGELRLPIETPGIPTGASDPLSAPIALLEAAELCFATNQTERGKKIAEQALPMLLPSSVSTPDAPAYAASIRAIVVGTVLGKVTLQSTELNTIRFRFKEASLNVDVDVGADLPPATVDALVAVLIACGLGAPHWEKFLRLSGDSQGMPNQLATATVSQILDLLPLFAGKRPLWLPWLGPFPPGLTQADLDEADATWIALHGRYATRLRLLYLDRERLGKMRFRVPAIDWTLLTLHVAIRRLGLDMSWKIEGMTPAHALHDFLAALAVEIGGRQVL